VTALVAMPIAALVLAVGGLWVGAPVYHRYQHQRCLVRIAALESELGIGRPSVAAQIQALRLAAKYQTAARPWSSGPPSIERGICVVVGCGKKSIGTPYPRLCKEHAG